MKHLDMVTCQALRRLGFPQESFHFRWYWHLDHPRWPIKPGPMVICEKVFSAPGFGWGGPWQVDYVACPSPLEALEWLEQEKNYQWGRRLKREEDGKDVAQWYVHMPFVRAFVMPAQMLYVTSAFELVRAVCNWLEADAVEEQVKQKEED